MEKKEADKVVEELSEISRALGQQNQELARLNDNLTAMVGFFQFVVLAGLVWAAGNGIAALVIALT